MEHIEKLFEKGYGHVIIEDRRIIIFWSSIFIQILTIY